MLTWSKPNAIVPDKPLRWILTTLRFYAIVASVGIALAFVVISILALAPRVLHHNVNPTGAGDINRIEGGAGTVVILVAMVILFGAATYLLGRLYGTAGYIACGAGFVVVCVGLEYFGGVGLFG